MVDALYILRDAYLKDLDGYAKKAENGKMTESDYKMVDLINDTLIDMCTNIDYFEELEREKSRSRQMAPYYSETKHYARVSDRIADLRQIMESTTDKDTRERLRGMITEMERDI